MKAIRRQSRQTSKTRWQTNTTVWWTIEQWTSIVKSRRTSRVMRAQLRQPAGNRDAGGQEEPIPSVDQR